MIIRNSQVNDHFSDGDLFRFAKFLGQGPFEEYVLRKLHGMMDQN